MSRNVLYARDVVHNVYPQAAKIQNDQKALWPLPSQTLSHLPKKQRV